MKDEVIIYMNNKEYEKSLDEIKKQILREGDTLVTKRALLTRFCNINEEYKTMNLLQILANINILIGQEPNDDVVSREEVFEMVEQIQDAGGFVGYNTYSLAFDTVDNMKPAKCTVK